jgi:hypothetical protein
MPRGMRTTLTIDDDVAAQIDQLRRSRDASLKDIINDALRRGLQHMSEGRRPRRAFRTRTFDAGAVRIPSLDNVAETLAMAEGEAFR